MKMPFGKYKGEDLEDIPVDYLMWLEENATHLNKLLRDEINYIIERKTGDITSLGRVSPIKWGKK